MGVAVPVCGCGWGCGVWFVALLVCWLLSYSWFFGFLVGLLVGSLVGSLVGWLWFVGWVCCNSTRLAKITWHVYMHAVTQHQGPWANCPTHRASPMSKQHAQQRRRDPAAPGDSTNIHKETASEMTTEVSSSTDTGDNHNTGWSSSLQNHTMAYDGNYPTFGRLALRIQSIHESTRLLQHLSSTSSRVTDTTNSQWTADSSIIIINNRWSKRIGTTGSQPQARSHLHNYSICSHTVFFCRAFKVWTVATWFT